MAKLDIFWGMTEDAIRERVVQEARKWLNVTEGSARHKEIVDVYNSQKKLPRGYKLRYTDAWCAGFISFLGIELCISHVILPEVGCGPMIELYRKAGHWEERDDYVPRPGDLIMYDWEDDGEGDNTGSPNHVGMVLYVRDGIIYVIEGNYRDRVMIREIPVGARYIRGFCLPDYAALVRGFADVPTESTEALRPGDSGSRVFLLQTLLKGAGYFYGLPSGEYDEKTTAAVMDFQLYNGLEVDGKAGPKTQAKIRGGNFAVRTATDEEVDTVGINRYKRIEDVPEYARPTVAKLVDRGLLLGVDVDDLGLSDDLLRMLVINDRAGLYDMTE